MRNQLQAELKQSKAFPSLREELWLSLSRTTAVVSHKLETRLREYGLSRTQYNVLRILRGAPDGLRQYEIRERLVAQVPDVPRILDRMEKNGLIQRERGAEDRRSMITMLTETGSRLVDELDEPMNHWIDSLFERLDDAEMQAIIDGLAKARSTSQTP